MIRLDSHCITVIILVEAFGCKHYHQQLLLYLNVVFLRFCECLRGIRQQPSFLEKTSSQPVF